MTKDIIIFNSWEDITISSYLKMKELDIKSTTYTADIVKLLCSLTDEDLNKISAKELESVAENFNFLQTPPELSTLLTLHLNGEDYNVRSDKNRMSAGSYIAIQPYIKDAESHILDIISCVITPKNSKYDDDTYILDELKEELLNHLNIKDALSIMSDVNKTFLYIEGTFINFFGERDEDEEDDEDEEEVVEEQTFDKVWVWMILAEKVRDIIQEPLKEVWKMKIMDFFTYASYVKDKNNYEQEQIAKYKQQ